MYEIIEVVIWSIKIEVEIQENNITAHINCMFSDLTRRNWAAGVVCKDSGDDGLNPGTAAAAPGEIETRAFDEELVLAGGNSGIGGGLRIGDGGDGGGVPGTVIGGLLDSEQESNEEEGGEEVKEGGSLVSQG